MTQINYKSLYITTDEIKTRFKPSLSNYFDVFISSSFDKISNSDINFLAYEAVLPGTSYETTQVFGDRQGITETFANKRVYPPVDISFYIDNDYSILKFFEGWMAKMSPNEGSVGTSYQKFRYPGNNSSGYKKEVIITKFEREFKPKSDRLKSGGNLFVPPSCIYTLRNAYPTNLISVPISYDQGGIMRTTVTFNYDVYAFAIQDNKDSWREINKPSNSSSSSITTLVKENTSQTAGVAARELGIQPFASDSDTPQSTLGQLNPF